MHKHALRIFFVFLLACSVSAQSVAIGKGQRESLARIVKYDSILKKENLRNWMKRLTARPHHVGSPYGKQNAEFIASQFRAWGFETKIEQYDVLFPTPKSRLLEMTAPEKFTAKLLEPTLAEDATSGQTSEQLPTYNAYSIDGDVSGDVVFVNYGIPSDYEELAKRGISVKGKIVLAKYGGSWRGIKPKVAAENGAIGCILYSDPRNDGYFRGDVYPKGPWRMEYGAQRGSVMDMPLYPGDVLTPNVGAVKGAKRLPVKDAPTLTKIPVLPISYADALPILKNLGGQLAPGSWRGALPITYHIGGTNNLNVHIKLAFNWDIKPAYNVIAKIRGSERPDQWIMRGNHHDAWVNGAADPVSGMVALMEEARGIGELVKGGWKPKRTIVYAAWDAEEPGLIGSTEWVEHHREELKEKLAVYINTDGYGRGFLGVGGSHTLEKFINDVAKTVPDPQRKGMSVWERARARRFVTGDAKTRKEVTNRKDLRIGALGSGSDYTPFLQHLGVASLNIGFGGESGGGSYHSAYDSFDHFTRFRDPGFQYGIALAKVCGRATIGLADADILPFSFTNFAETVGGYIDDIEKLTDRMRNETAVQNRMIRDGSLKAVQDPTKPFVTPNPKSEVPFLNFAPLRNALLKLEASAKKYKKASPGVKLSLSQQRELDKILYKTERALTRSHGLPRRSWFKHQIYAPGFYTGYGVKTLPGVREAIEQREWREAGEQIDIVSNVIEGVALEIEKAASLRRTGGRRP